MKIFLYVDNVESYRHAQYQIVHILSYTKMKNLTNFEELKFHTVHYLQISDLSFLQSAKYEVVLSEILHIGWIQHFLHARIFSECFTTSNCDFQNFENKGLPVGPPSLVHSQGNTSFLDICSSLVL